MDAVARNGTVLAAFSAACVHPLTNFLFSRNKRRIPLFQCGFIGRLLSVAVLIRTIPFVAGLVYHRIARLRNVAALAKQVALVSAAG
jgi:hypothetical protein